MLRRTPIASFTRASGGSAMVAGGVHDLHSVSSQRRHLTPAQMDIAKQRGAAISARLHPNIRKTLNIIRAEPQRATLKKPVIPMGKSLYFSNMTRKQRVFMFQSCQTLNLERLEALRLKGVNPDAGDTQNALFNAALFQRSVGGVWKWEGPKTKGTSIDLPEFIEEGKVSEPWKPKCIAAAHKLWEDSIERSRTILTGPVDSKYWKLNAISNLQTWQGEKTNDHLTSLEGTFRRLLQEMEKKQAVSNPHIRILFQMLNRHHPELMEEGRTGRQLETLGKLFKSTSFHMQWALRQVYNNNAEIRKRVLEQCAEETMFRLHLEKMLAWSPEIRLLQGGYRSIQLQATSEYRLSKAEVFQLLIDGLVQQRQIDLLSVDKPLPAVSGAKDDKKPMPRSTGEQLERLKATHGDSIFNWKKKKHYIVKRSIADRWDEMALNKREKLEIVTSFYTPQKKKKGQKKAVGLNPFRRFFMPKESIRIRHENPGMGEEELMHELVDTYNGVFKGFFKSESEKVKRMEGSNGNTSQLRSSPRDLYMQVLDKWMGMSRKEQKTHKIAGGNKSSVAVPVQFPLVAGSSDEPKKIEKKRGSKKEEDEESVENLLMGDGPAILGV